MSAIVNREKGAGSRALLDSRLNRLKIDPKSVRGYNRVAPGHLQAAWQVQSGQADCCIATRAAARVFGLGFIPLVSERYDLAIRRQHLDMPSIQILLDTLNRSNYRRELESLGGYDARAAGQRLLIFCTNKTWHSQREINFPASWKASKSALSWRTSSSRSATI